MALLRRTFELLIGIFQRSSGAEGVQHHNGSNTIPPSEQDGGPAYCGGGEESNERSKIWFEQIDGSRKRKLVDDMDSHISKKGRSEKDRYSNDSAYVSSRVDETHNPIKALRTDQKTDRDLMPPPASPANRQDVRQSTDGRRRESFESLENYSEARSHRAKAADFENEYDMEMARRRAAATQLPPNSGNWEPSEQELFFHLAYRGFEPLLSNTWMTDFPTLPISLFAVHPDQTPLIKPHRSTEFRAIKALRDLIDTGKVVRDRTLANSSGLRSEPIIEKAAKKYIKWSLNDIGVSSKKCIPVHTVVGMKQGQTTKDTVRELAVKMHKLSTRHREECNILTSIEQEEANSRPGRDETHLNENPSDPEHKLPIIYGLMICSSLIAVFTLNSHTPPPAFVVHAQKNKTHGRSNTNDGADGAGEADEEQLQENDIDEDEDSGLRFISSFDFSNHATDVWNAFVIAIVAMMIRKSLIDVYEIPAAAEGLEEEGSILEDSSLIDEFSLGRNRYTVRYAVGTGN